MSNFKKITKTLFLSLKTLLIADVVGRMLENLDEKHVCLKVVILRLLYNLNFGTLFSPCKT